MNAEIDRSRTLTGITWDHPRGLDPLVATAAEYGHLHPAAPRIKWGTRSLLEFGETPLEALASRFDLLVVDHPHVGSAANSGALLPLDEYIDTETLAGLRRRSVGRSHDAYNYGGHQWALAIDSASQVSVHRADQLDNTPVTWPDVIKLARTGVVLWALNSTDASCSFLTLLAQNGTPWSASDTIDISDIQAILEIMRELFHHLPSSCVDLNAIDVLEELSASGTPFTYSPLLFGYTNYSRVGFRARLLSYGKIPANVAGRTNGSLLGGAGIAISRRTPDSAASVAYALWIAGGSCQSTLYTSSGGQPAHLDAWESPEADLIVGGFFSATRSTMDGSWVRPRTNGFVNVQVAIGEKINGWLRGRTTSTRPLAAELRDLAARAGC